MEIVGIVFVQLCFIAGGIAIGVFLINKSSQRPIAASGNKSLVIAFKSVVNKIPGLSESDRDLSADTGTFYTTAPCGNVWERLIEIFTRHPIHPNPDYQWKGFNIDEPYNRIQMRSGWSESQRHPSAPASNEFTTNYTCTLTCTLSLENLESGGTAVHFKHESFNGTMHGFDLMAFKIRRATNERLRNMCLQMTQDPNHGMPY